MSKLSSIDTEINKRYVEMLIRKATKAGECLNCHRNPQSKYPKVGPYELASRFVFTTLNGGIPDGHFVCHTCDNPRCINPEHLFVGTRQDNTDDMMAKGRQGNVGGCKPRMFTSEEEDEMSKLSIEGYSQRQIAVMYSTSQAMISMSLKRHGERNVR